MQLIRQKLLRSARTPRGQALDRRFHVAPQATSESPGALGRPPLRVLVVDDDAAIRDLVTSALLDQGYQVVTAVNGAQALERLPEFDPDVILLDIQMPEMVGPTFADRCRQTAGRQAPIVVFSAAGGLAHWVERLGPWPRLTSCLIWHRFHDCLSSAQCLDRRADVPAGSSGAHTERPFSRE